MTEAWIIDACRTPRGVGKAGKGALWEVHPQQLGATVLKALAERNKIDTKEVGDVIWGTAAQVSKQSGDLGRMFADTGGRIRQAARRLLARKRRLVICGDLARQLARLADLDDNVLRAEVTSAGTLSEAYLGRLKAELEKSTGKKIMLTQKQDPSLIGGVVTRIGDTVIDGSVRARLASFRESLLRT